MKIAFDVHARQPNVQLVKHDAVRQVHGTKEFRLGEFKEANVGAVKNNARRVNVAPAHALLNRIFFVFRQSWNSPAYLSSEAVQSTTFRLRRRSEEQAEACTLTTFRFAGLDDLFAPLPR